MADFLIYLLEEDGRSLTVQNGVVTPVTSRQPLRYTPDKWQEMQLGWERDYDRLGILRNFSEGLSFVKDGAQICRKAFYSSNIDIKRYLLIQQLGLELTPTEYALVYNFLYKGLLDMTTGEDDGGVRFNVSIGEEGIRKKLLAKWSTTYEIALPEIIRLDGINMQQRLTFITILDEVLNDNSPYFEFVGREGEASGLTAHSATNDEANGLNYFLSATQDITGIRVQAVLPARAVIGGTIGLRIVDQNANPVVTLFSTPATTDFQTVTIDTTFNVTAGSQYYMETIGHAVFDQAEFLFSFQSRFRETTCAAITPFDLLTQLVYKATGIQNAVVSPLLQSYARFMLTSGDAVRRFEGAVIKTSLQDFHNTFRWQVAGGMSTVDDTVYYLPVADLFNPANPINLGEVKDLKVNQAERFFYNKVKVGYNNPQIDDLNGRWEFNAGQVYSTPSEVAEGELNMIVPYPAAPFMIERYRINLEGKKTTDNANDNVTFIIDVNDPLSFTPTTFSAFDLFGLPAFNILPTTDRDSFIVGGKFTITGAPVNNGTYTITQVGQPTVNGFVVTVAEAVTPAFITGATITMNTHTLRRPAYTTITGVPSPETIFNTQLSPTSILKRNQSWLDSVCYGFAGQSLTLETADKNRELYTDLNGDITDEKAPQPIGNSGVFITKMFSFQVPMPRNLTDLLKNNENAPYRFTWNSDQYVGFVDRSGLALVTGKEQSVKLLSAPQDLSKLQ